MAAGNDMKAHAATYASFIKAATWGTGFVILVTAFVVVLISG
ncbi:aa3-type cytochrome c oxidase subunit IV [Novosphingobium colocasiae]|nr:aa3-type cytochrome c oxidase subunit IV [Novosphingobium colocasiae]